MRKFLWPGAFTLCLTWAFSSTWLYWDLYKKSELFLNQHTELSTESALILETQELKEFTKDFLEKNFTYTHKNFAHIRQTQARFLTPDLRVQYLEETNRIAERLKERPLDYSAKLIELSFSNEQSFVGIIEVNLRNENRKVFFQITGNLIRSTRSLENTAGLLLSHFSSREMTPASNSPVLVPLASNRPLSLLIPCKVEDFESPAQSVLNSQLKVFASTSEIQITVNTPLTADTPLKIRCRDWFYDLVIKDGSNEYLAYKVFNLKEGQRVNRNKKDSYDLLIDKVLGNSSL